MLGHFNFRTRLGLFVLVAMLIWASILPLAGVHSSVAAAQEATNGAAVPAAPAPQAEPANEQSILAYGFKALGVRYTLAFGFLSFSAVALLVMNILSLRRDSMCPVQLVEAFEAQLNEKKYQEAYELAKADESFLGQVLAAGLAKLSAGYDRANKAMEEVGEEENMKLEHRLGYMALIGTIAPMVGLFGTVDGMISAFMVIGQTNTTPKPSELADGVSTALVTTYVGLAIAIPTIAAFNLLKNRLTRLLLDVAVTSESMMGRFENVSATPK